MSSPAFKMRLSEEDVELSFVGSIFLDHGILDMVAGEVSPEWLSEPLARYMYEAALRIHDAGNRITPATIVAALPEQAGTVSRNQLYARACAAGLPASSIGGLVHTLKDRWARRMLVEIGQDATAAAQSFESDPYQAAMSLVDSLDNIGAVQSERRGGTLADASAALFSDIENKKGMRGATTGLLALDNKFNGYKPGQLVVIAGRPGMGKSAFMCSSLRRTAETGIGVMIFSLEMTRQEIAARMLSDSCDTVHAPFFGSILKDTISSDQAAMIQQANEALADLPIGIEDSARMTFAQIAAKARKAKAKMNHEGRSLSVVCIDHMGLVTPSDRYSGNKVAEAGEVSGRARALAKELDCCVVLLCQLSREVEKRDDKRPVMSDLRWSGEIEQDAHVVGFLYREAYYLAQDAKAEPADLMAARNSLEFLIRKNRNGETSDVSLWCSIGHSSVRDQ